MSNFSPIRIYISSNCKSGGPFTFVNNFKKFFGEDKRILLVKNIRVCNRVILIGENYLIKDLFLCILFGKTFFLRLDGRRFNFFSKVDFHRKGNNGLKKFFKSIFFEFKVLIAFILSSQVIYQSEFTRKQWLFFEHILKKNFSIIINPFHFTKKKDFKEDLINSNISKVLVNKYVVISKGFIHKSELLFEAYNVLSKMGIQILVFGRYEPKIKKKFPLIKFFGYVDNNIYLEFLKGCFAFMCIEDNACCPNSLIEAQSIGKPIIGPKNGSLPEMCPEPMIQLLNYGTSLNRDLENLINEFINNYQLWVKKSIVFSKNNFSNEQYNKYYEILVGEN